MISCRVVLLYACLVACLLAGIAFETDGVVGLTAGAWLALAVGLIAGALLPDL